MKYKNLFFANQKTNYYYILLVDYESEFNFLKKLFHLI